MPDSQLPAAIHRLCADLQAPSRLVAHLSLVHDVACELLDAIAEQYPTIAIEREEILFGAATHDIGKVVHPEELSSPGNRHESAGEQLLARKGYPPHLTRFARTHAAWDEPGSTLEDLIVALADHVWKGERCDSLESLVVRRLAEEGAMSEWEVWSWLDATLERIATNADQRLNWQQRSDT